MNNKNILFVKSFTLLLLSCVCGYLIIHSSLYLWGTAIFQNNDKAVDLLTKAIKSDPFYFQAHLDLGWAFYEKSYYDKALSEFKNAIEIKNYDSSALYGISLILKEKGDIKECFKKLSSILKEDPQYPWAYITRANILKTWGKETAALFDLISFEIIKGDFVKALNYANLILEKDSTHHKAFSMRAEIKVRLKDYDGAFKDYDRSIQLNPENPWYLYKRGKFRKEMDAYDGALEDFLRAVSLDVKFSEAYEMIADIYLIKNDKIKYCENLYMASKSHKFHRRLLQSKICAEKIKKINPEFKL